MQIRSQIINLKVKKDSSKKEYLFAKEILSGLSKYPKSVPSKYIYDSGGSKLFEAIMKLPEYYPTRCENEILRINKGRIANLISDKPFNVIELGAGNGEKTSILLKHFLKSKFDFKYIPIDISESAIKNLLRSLHKTFPKLKTIGLIAEYEDALKYLKIELTNHRNLVLFLGSSIGNFTPTEINSFLGIVKKSLSEKDYFLIGFDLKKNPKILQKAYNDSRGITAKFNLNLLSRINQELGGNFEINQFQHHEFYNPLRGAMESYLISSKKQTAYIGKIRKNFHFEPWEPIHTEFSYKYNISQIENLAYKNGFRIKEQYYDSKNYFTDSIWQVRNQ